MGRRTKLTAEEEGVWLRRDAFAKLLDWHGWTIVAQPDPEIDGPVSWRKTTPSANNPWWAHNMPMTVVDGSKKDDAA
jgi:hypothetical protein